MSLQTCGQATELEVAVAAVGHGRRECTSVHRHGLVQHGVVVKSNRHQHLERAGSAGDGAELHRFRAGSERGRPGGDEQLAACHRRRACHGCPADKVAEEEDDLEAHSPRALCHARHDCGHIRRLHTAQWKIPGVLGYLAT